MIRAPVLLAILLCVSIPIDANADCGCSAERVTENVRNAGRVFSGVVQSATMIDDGDARIEFVVQVNKAIRGSFGKEVTLSTALPEYCGVSVRLGFHDMFVLSASSQVILPCSGSGRKMYTEMPLLQMAIILVDQAGSDPTEAARLLGERFYSSYDRSTVEEFFDLVEMIDTSGYSASSYADRIEYRGVVVYFNDGKYDRIEKP